MNIEIPVRRMDFDFKSSLKDKYWFYSNPWMTHFVNSLSAVFPDGERFFIDTVREHRSKIKNPELKKAISAFIGQEGHHGKEHEEFNKLLEKRFDVPMKVLALKAKTFLKLHHKILSKKHSLAITIALEHFTAIFADWLLKNPEIVRDLQAAHGEMFLWHAVEETEHKAVAFDVYEEIYNDDLTRYVMMVYISAWFLSQHFLNIIVMVAKDKELLDWKSFLGLVKFMYNPKNGMFTNLLPAWLDYFKRGFHPWDHDNRHLIEPYIREYESKVIPKR